jgi:hypothetical protein
MGPSQERLWISYGPRLEQIRSREIKALQFKKIGARKNPDPNSHAFRFSVLQLQRAAHSMLVINNPFSGLVPFPTIVTNPPGSICHGNKAPINTMIYNATNGANMLCLSFYAAEYFFTTDTYASH